MPQRASYLFWFCESAFVDSKQSKKNALYLENLLNAINTVNSKGLSRASHGRFAESFRQERWKQQYPG